MSKLLFLVLSVVGLSTSSFAGETKYLGDMEINVPELELKEVVNILSYTNNTKGVDASTYAALCSYVVTSKLIESGKNIFSISQFKDSDNPLARLGSPAGLSKYCSAMGKTVRLNLSE